MSGTRTVRAARRSVRRRRDDDRADRAGGRGRFLHGGGERRLHRAPTVTGSQGAVLAYRPVASPEVPGNIAMNAPEMQYVTSDLRGRPVAGGCRRRQAERGDGSDGEHHGDQGGQAQPAAGGGQQQSAGDRQDAEQPRDGGGET